MYAFTWFLLGYLEQEFSLSFTTFAEVLASRPQVRHLWPVRLVLRDWRMGSPFIRAVQGGVLNYVAVRSGGVVDLVSLFLLLPSPSPAPYYAADDDASSSQRCC